VGRDELEARRRNEQLVSHLEDSGAVSDPAVVTAFRAVLRHRFLPGRPLDEVYEDAAIMTKSGDRGFPISSSSQPAIMAVMLQLLRLRAGHRVLEIGAGTGYNAALMANLAGRDGHVVTVDIDAEMVERARAHLAAAGVEGVEVVQADGAGGWPAGAPFDRVIVTAGTHDVSPAWVDQLVEEGRLVLPLGLAGPAQQCVALVRRGRVLSGEELCPCGFMPLRGEMAPGPEAADDQLAGWLSMPGRDTGHSVPAGDLRAGFAMWLALTQDGYVTAGTGSEAAGGPGLRDGRGVALVCERSEEGRNPVLVFGDGDVVARRLIAAHRAWARDRPPFDRLRISAHPAGEEPDAPAGARVVRRPHFTFVVSTA
jgi:protein-L-isoaspartate(D-aspartate) O-methyltransferase